MDFDLVRDAYKWGPSSTYGTAGGTVQWSFWTQDFGTEGFDFAGSLTFAMQAEVRAAFARWSEFAEINFQEVPDSLNTANNGIRIGYGAQIDGTGNTLALTHRSSNATKGIKAAEFEIDPAEGWSLRSDGYVRNSAGAAFYTVALHEIGHALGLAHYDGAPAIMNEAAGSLVDLQLSDIHGIQYIYGARLPVLTLTPSQPANYEGDGGTRALTFTVTRANSTAGTSTAVWTVAGSGANPAAADDFGGVFPSGVVTFAPGEVSATISVTVAGDTTLERDEGFTVTLSSPTNARLSGSIASGMIINDERVLVVNLSGNGATPVIPSSVGSSNYESPVSSDGRFIAFYTMATNFSGQDTNGAGDIYLRDVASGTTSRISVNFALGASFPSMSSDGRYFAFTSLVTSPSTSSNVYLHDRVTGATTLVSDAALINNNTPTVSDDGRYVAYTSLPQSNTQVADIHLRDMATGTDRIISAGAHKASYSPAISADGKFVAFLSESLSASPAVPNELFLHNVAAGTTTRIAGQLGSTQGTSFSDENPFAPAISGNGRYVAYAKLGAPFGSFANGKFEVFVADTVLGTTSLVSTGVNSAGNHHSFQPALSDNGRFVAFLSNATDLVSGDTNGRTDIFVKDILTGALELVSRDAFGGQIQANTATPSLSADGRYITFKMQNTSVTGELPIYRAENPLWNPLVAGTIGIDTLNGTGAGETLYGDNGADTLLAGAGADTLIGGAGADKLSGEAGGDRFLFTAAALADAQAATPLIDWITDFNHGNTGAFNAVESDRIDVTALVAAAFLGGQQVGNLVRVLSDGTNARLQIDTDGAAHGAGWVNLARVDGLQAGQQLGVFVNGTAAAQLITVLGSETINNQDGTRIDHRVDALNGQSYTDYYIYYDALGRVTSQLTNNDDGSRVNQVWDVQSHADWANYYITYDSQSRIVGQVTQNDNSSYTVLKWDVANGEDWADYYVTYDGQNRPITQVTNNDGGSRIVFKWDRENQQEWSDYRVTYDGQGRPITQVTNNDDGSRIVFKWDLDNQFAWTDYRVTDKQGRSLSQVTNNDNGTHQTYAWDAANQASWSDYVVTTDSQNRATEQTTHYDDGTYTVAKWDVVNQFGWREMTDYYNAQGQHVQQRGVYDDGTPWLT